MCFVTNTTYANNFVNESINLAISTGKDWCFTQFSTGMAGWLLLSASFTAKFGLVFVCKTLFLRGFSSKPTERA